MGQLKSPGSGGEAPTLVPMSRLLARSLLTCDSAMSARSSASSNSCCTLRNLDRLVLACSSCGGSGKWEDEVPARGSQPPSLGDCLSLSWVQCSHPSSMFLPQSCQGHPVPGLAPSSKLSSTQNPSWPPMAQEESHAAWSDPA